MNELGYHPNMKTPEEKNGLMCFLDQQRVCGADCMSYLTVAPTGDDYRGHQWSNCHVLVNMHRGGKHLVVLAQIASDRANKAKVAAADQQRLNQPPPPVAK